MTDQTLPTSTPPAETPPAEVTFTEADRVELEERVAAAEQAAEKAAQAAAAASGTESRFAIYDKTYLRYLPGVHDTKQAAEKAAKADKGLRYRIDEV